LKPTFTPALSKAEGGKVRKWDILAKILPDYRLMQDGKEKKKSKHFTSKIKS